ncbi:hypothetical protein HAX54_044974, partial [Datura stramonium]|nr:hypothetical protein [Datura stramonium]
MGRDRMTTLLGIMEGVRPVAGGLWVKGENDVGCFPARMKKGVRYGCSPETREK